MNWGGFDLNLLTVFDAVMQERNLTRAGQRLGLTQPAVSHALARLRHLMKDELFVRGPEGMVPTARAQQIAGPVHEALAGLQIALEPQASEPEDIVTEFNLAFSSYIVFNLACLLVARIRADAPRIGLTIRLSSNLNILNELDNGSIDLAITRLIDGGERFRCVKVVSDRFVCVTRKNHPVVRRGLISMEDLADLPHLKITSDGDYTSFVDEMLERQGLSRHVAMGAPFLAAPQLLASGRLISVLPERTAERMCEIAPLAKLPLPFDSPALEMVMTWHRRHETHPAHRWLRDTIRQVLSEVQNR
ncbi:MAG: LysR family transcriptional regulator [Acetobacteraceae bacterium]|nr:LysR family transcriptional regulator [Acetobacteraceae bacterium]MBV8588537.1 LysR family transcriptional regulator [Acetobacteraceae bacterium]